MAKFTVTAGWKDCAHLTPDAIEEMKAAYPEHELEARMNGTPSLGEGKIYSVPEADFVVDDFDIPAFWWRCYGLDVGWKRTSAIWAAHNRDEDVVYFYSEHYAGDAIPALHAEAIKARDRAAGFDSSPIPGVIDPAARGRSQIDGQRLIDLYTAAGLDLEPADNSVEAGIYAIRQRLVAGKLKVFKSLTNWLAEYRLYRRDEKGKVFKSFDHAQDSGRYCISSGLERARQPGPRRSPYARSGGRVFSG
jgi:Terminase RNaseH-like domain